MTPDQAARKFHHFMDEVIEVVSTSATLCMPNEAGIDIPGAGIEDNEQINLHKAFTQFWLLKMARRNCVALNSRELNRRVSEAVKIAGF